jgi:uncharacterized protein YkwD
MLPAAAETAPPRRIAARLAGLLVLALALATLVLPASPALAGSDEAHIASRVNSERTARGLPALRQVADLQAVARQHAQVMASTGRMHHNPLLTSQVVSWSRVAENVGYAPSAEAVHVALMASPGHRANILDRGVSQMGIGVVWSGGRLWVTQVFRQPTGAAASLPAVGAPPAPAPPPPPPPPPPPAPMQVFQAPAACQGVPASRFADVPRTAWNVGAIDCALGKGLAQGLSPSHYGPERSVTRGQMASFLHRLLLRSPKAAGAAAPDAFRDDAGSPHESAINALAARGILNGTAPGTFGPGQPVTRGQSAAMLVRLQEHLAGPMAARGVPFADVAGSSHAAAIDKVFTAGIAAGTSATTFSPNAGVRRDGMTVFLVRSFGGLHKAGVLA